MSNARQATASTLYPYQRVADQDGQTDRRHSVVIVGGGPVGMAMALDLVRKDNPVLVLDEHEGVSHGSRAICFARRTLEIADRLGCGRRMLDKGVVWNVGKVFHAEQEVFRFNLSPDAGSQFPAFINLQQPYVEQYLVDQIRNEQERGAPIEIRGGNKVINLIDQGDHVRMGIQTPEGEYTIEADWLIACDGARSSIRHMMDLGFEGRVFEDNFLIADVKMTAPFPSERWFWFQPPFKDAGQSALLHKQPDDIWRIDFQLGWDIDREAELQPTKIRQRVDAMLGDGIEYELEWTSIYTFQCRRMDQFRHGSILFAGDSAHQVSPFGARGANSGIQDADNLGWKLDLILKGKASETLLDSYSEERVLAADENILNSTRATDFLTPKSDTSLLFRNAVLELARHHPFARPLVNSGRLSVPCVYDMVSLNGPDALVGGPDRTRVGASCIDVSLNEGFLLERLGGEFVLLCINAEAPEDFNEAGIDVSALFLRAAEDPTGTLTERYLGSSKSAIYLIRPDQHVTGRWNRFDDSQVRQALRKAIGIA